MDSVILFSKLASLPENMKSEVSGFINLLLSKAKKDKTTVKPKPTFGSAKGMFIIHADFDEPLEDFKDYMN